MGKHSKNNNDRAFFSNAERRAAAFGRHSSAMLSGHNTGANFKEAGWGTDARQLDSDSMKEIDACSLSLQPCADPVVTMALSSTQSLHPQSFVSELTSQSRKRCYRAAA